MIIKKYTVLITGIVSERTACVCFLDVLARIQGDCVLWNCDVDGNVVNYGADGLRLLAPVPVGSTLHARNRITDVREHRKGTLVATQVAIHVVGNDDIPAVLYDALSLYQG